jgi:hypothetical protein
VSANVSRNNRLRRLTSIPAVRAIRRDEHDDQSVSLCDGEGDDRNRRS